MRARASIRYRQLELNNLLGVMQSAEVTCALLTATGTHYKLQQPTVIE